MAEIRQTFFLECEDLLVETETGLMEMQDGGADAETVNAVFRAVHSIKGGAGAFGLDALVKFAHTFETTLDEVRSNRLEASPEVMKVFLRSADVLADLVRAAREDDAADDPRAGALMEELSAFVGGDTSGGEEEEIDFEPLGLDFDFDDAMPDLAEADLTNRFVVIFRPKPELYASGNEAGVLLKALREFGEVEVTCDASGVPDLNDLDPEGAYLQWTLTIVTENPRSDVLEIFEFVDGDCELSVLSADDAPTAVDDDQAIAVEVDVEAPIPLEVDATPVASLPPAPMPAPSVETAASRNADKKAVEKVDASAKSGPTVRVDLERVDRLINLVGELVINQAMLTQSIVEDGAARASAIETRLDELKQLTRELQESVMAIRAQPVKSLFQRMSRIVRECADATGKSARLITDGEATEVDKTVIERLSDPLTHMIRNAIDHGLESTEKRLAAGKSAEGSVHLRAAHRSGRVIIEVSDDGAGINRERVRQIAVEKGLVAPDAKLTDAEIDNLIFMPGFSTAKEVSNLSGRGVGMDVVKRAIQSLGGKVSISSIPGRGSTFSISLPLTLAILDGMVVRVGTETLVVPLTAIIETWKPTARDIESIGSGLKVVAIRGEYIPLIDVGVALGYRDEPITATDGVIIFVESNGHSRCALVVDAIQDQRQVVIKSLQENYGAVPFIAAATILGDGRIALILDVDAMTVRTGADAEPFTFAETG